MRKLMVSATLLLIAIFITSCGSTTQEGRVADQKGKATEIAQAPVLKTEPEHVQTTAVVMENDEMESMKALVSEAYAFMKSYGQQATFAEVNNPSGLFVKEELFVYIINIDNLGRVVASSDKSLLHKTMRTKDDNKKLFIKEIMKQADQSHNGYMTYKWKNKIRSCYLVKYEQFVIIGSN